MTDSTYKIAKWMSIRQELKFQVKFCSSQSWPDARNVSL